MPPVRQPEHQDPPAAVCMKASALVTQLRGTLDATAPPHAHVKFLQSWNHIEYQGAEDMHAFELCTCSQATYSRTR